MRVLLIALTALISVAAAPTISGAVAAVSPTRPLGYQYLSPLPGSRLVPPGNNVVFRPGDLLDRATLSRATVTVTGSTSGAHAGRLVLSDDGRTLVFNPDQPFAAGESVVASLAGDLRTESGAAVTPVAFDFTVAPHALSRADAEQFGLTEWMERSELGDAASLRESRAMDALRASAQAPARSQTVLDPCYLTVPAGYRNATVLASHAPGTDPVFVALFGAISAPELLILDEMGAPLYLRSFPGQTSALDFKMQPNGLLTYFTSPANKYYAMDSSYSVVDSFTTGNGLMPDMHDVQLLPNGHVLIIAVDPQVVDMSVVVPGGNPNALVFGIAVQELDADHNVVFQWRSFDHYQITDCVSPLISLTSSSIDYVHPNAVELDQDGNLLLSARHLNEITKIDRSTGDIIWRMGANAVNNQFTFIGDSRGFSHQHDIRRLPNGDITLFDNGNYMNPQVSRAVEYQLDETAKTATNVWEYWHTPDYYGGFMGDVQRHADGSTTIGWGGTPIMTDLHPDGSIALEIHMPPGCLTYRAFRFPWRTTRFATDVDSLDFGTIDYLGAVILPVTVRNTSQTEQTINCVFATGWKFAVDGPIPATLAPGGTVTLNVTFVPGAPGDFTGRLYVREASDTEVVAQVVRLKGTSTAPLAVATPPALEFGLGQAEPNPTRGTTRISYTLPRAGAVSLALYDVHGRRVQTLVDAAQPAGHHELSWRPAGLPSGLYFCSLRAADRTAVTKIVLAN